MLKKILLATFVMISTGNLCAIPATWKENAERLAARIALFPEKFAADTILYNDTTGRLNLMISIYADEIENINTVFTCLREKFASLTENYNQVLADTEISIEDAAIKKLLLEGELANLIEEADAQIAVLTGERDVLKSERDALQDAYDTLVGDSKAAADDLVAKIRLVLDGYDLMVAAKGTMVDRLDTFKSDLESMFASLDAAATTAKNEIC